MEDSHMRSLFGVRERQKKLKRKSWRGTSRFLFLNLRSMWHLLSASGDSQPQVYITEKTDSGNQLHHQIVMDFAGSRSVRFDVPRMISSNKVCPEKKNPNPNQNNQNQNRNRRNQNNKNNNHHRSSSLTSRVLSRVFSEDYKSNRNEKIKVLDPRGQIIQRWNRIFLVACLVSLFVDPLFFYLPVIRAEMECIEISVKVEVILAVIRTLADLLYFVQILVRFRTAFVAPSSRVFGRGELVIDPSKISSRYLSKQFWIDLVAALPLPQVLICGVIPHLKGSAMANIKNVLLFGIIFQYIPRLLLIAPLSSEIVKATGVITETAWAGAAYNLVLYMLASHVLGACWYLFSIERKEACWKEICRLQSSYCHNSYFSCRNTDLSRNNWFKSSNIKDLCSPTNRFYQFGIFGDAVTSNIVSSGFTHKYFYCFWWGLKNLSSLGQNLDTSTYIGEIGFAIIIAILGLVLFGLLIGNMQSYLQSTTTRLEEWRIKRTDTEEWMRHRQLPVELRQNVRRYDQYKWITTRGVDEEVILRSLPMDLRRDIKRHLCLDLVRRVPLFDQMDERMLDAICERLKPALFTDGTCLVRELDPVNEMLFIIRGHLDSYMTNGGRTGFFNTCRIGSGDFCGEELLTWALDPRKAVSLPSSTRTVRTVSEVEAFALVADDLKFVAAQFRRLHSKVLRHKLRFYSHQWRTWAACFIQAAWRRQKRRRASVELMCMERRMAMVKPEEEKTVDDDVPVVKRHKAAETRVVRSTRRGSEGHTTASESGVGSPWQKPTEPDFSVEEES